MEEATPEQIPASHLSKGKHYIHNILYRWRWYTLGRERYQECMNKAFGNNLSSLRQTNTVVAALGCCFAIYPIFIEKNLFKGLIYITTAIISLLFAIFANYRLNQLKKGKQASNLLIYVLIMAYYANIILFGMYLSVLADPSHLAVTFMGILICALFLFITPPLFNLFLTLCAVAVFITVSFLVKSVQNWMLDTVNVLFAGFISLFFGWQIPMLRLMSVSISLRLEDERNRYYDQSTIDELTQLRNRRDFMQTFQRYISSYRSSDDWLCIAIADIDYFKKYNDHYGHPMGDDCLRAVGGVLNRLKDDMGIYTARVGGEEFALLWFQKEIFQVKKIISHVNEMIKALNIPHEKSTAAPYVTVRIGVYIERCGASSDIHALYDLAEKALYTAKRSGRNCTIVCGRELHQYKITPA